MDKMKKSKVQISKKHFLYYIFKIPIIGTFLAILYYIYKLLFLNNNLNSIYKEENFIEKLSLILNINIKKDWVGRLYGIINPTTQLSDEDSSLLVFEMKENGKWSIDSFIEEWIYKKLNILNSLLVETQMLDLLYINIKHVGPEDYTNYLITFTPYQFSNLKYYLKHLWIEIKYIFYILILPVLGFLTWKFLF